MIKIKFNNEETFKDVSFSKTEHTVTITGITDENTSGFKTYRLSGEQLGNFDNFTTIYDKGEDYVTFSNDGSVKSIQTEVTPTEPTTQIPTIEERLDAIDSAIEELAELVGGE